MGKLYVVIPAADGYLDMTRECLMNTESKCRRSSTEVLVFDNGVGAGSLGSGKNIGVYPVFFKAHEEISEKNVLDEDDVILFIHNDLTIHEHGFDSRILNAFMDDPKLGMLGFVGSNEICGSGGRGLGTMLNFQGIVEHSSPAEPHGKREPGLVAAAQVDGCSMAFRAEALRSIPFRKDFPIHHFYDRLLSCEILEKFHVAHLGISCDHVGGQTACKSDDYRDKSASWHKDRGLNAGDNPDLANYKLGEQIFLNEFRDEKKFFPLKVAADHSISRRS